MSKKDMSTAPWLEIDPSHGHPPFHRQIYDGFREAILSGRFRPGSRFPSTRALAEMLGISRLPVVQAYEQLLHEGYLVGRQGSGTFVAPTIPDDLSTPRAMPRVSAKAPARRSVAAGIERDAREPGPFRVSLPALDLFPLPLWSRMLSRHARSLTIGQMAYGAPSGVEPLRAAIAEHLRTSRAVHCEAADVLVVSGSQMALQICASTLLGPGRTVGIEEPGYPGAREALTSSGARVVPVPVDDEGLIVDALPPGIDAVYVTPSHQYPLGISMSASRRLALLDWARRSSGWVIEDDYDSEFRYASRPLGALQGMDRFSRVIYLGTFSRVLFPAVRLGYVVPPPELVNTFARHRQAIDLFPPVLEQLVVAEFLTDGHLARHVRRMRGVYASRRDALLLGLARSAGGVVPHNSDAGLHVTLFLDPLSDDRALVEAAFERGLQPTALSDCYLATPRPGLIIGFGGSTERRLLAACRTLGEILSDLNVVEAPRRRS